MQQSTPSGSTQKVAPNTQLQKLVTFKGDHPCRKSDYPYRKKLLRGNNSPSVDCFAAPSMKLGYTYEVSAAVYPLREYAKGTQWKRIAAWSSSLPFICVLATPLDDIGNIIVFPEPSSTTRVLARARCSGTYLYW